VSRKPGAVQGAGLPPQRLSWYPSPIDFERRLFGDVGASGLDLGLMEQRALHGLAVICAESRLNGAPLHVYVDDEESLLIEGSYRAPRLLLTMPDFYKACGVSRNKRGKYGSGEVDRLKDALFGLTGKRLAITQGLSKLRKSELDELKQHYSSDYPTIGDHGNIAIVSASRHYVVTLTPMVLSRIDTFFSKIPLNLYDEIKAHCPKSKQAPLFIRYLLTLNKIAMNEDKWNNVHGIAEQTIAKKLWLSGLPKRVLRENLLKIFWAAREMGFLLDFHQRNARQPVYQLKLNPERCARLNQRNGHMRSR
jgi:hypothetical protein